MTDIHAGFHHINGSCIGAWNTPRGRGIDVFVICDPALFNSPSSRLQLQLLWESTDDLIDKASTIAYESVYREDIDAEGGSITVNGIVVTAWDDIRIWFDLGRSSRMCSVWFLKGEAVEVWCDHP